MVVSAAIALPVVLSESDGESGAEAKPDRAGDALALDNLPTGAKPQGGYLVGAEFRDGAKSVSFTLETGTEVTELVTVSGGYLLSISDALGNQRVRFVADDGTMSRTWDVDRDSFFPTWLPRVIAG